MELRVRKALLLVLAIFLLLPLHTKAAESLANREEVLHFLKSAFQAQVSLSEQERNLEEINAILSPYFSSEYMNLFLAENLVEINGQFITYGSDFAPYYIPFFRFSTKTKVVKDGSHIYVYEYFPASGDGPVTYNSHYEGLLLEKNAGRWKVKEYLYDSIPEHILNNSSSTYKPKTEVIYNNHLFARYFSIGNSYKIKPQNILTRFQMFFTVEKNHSDFLFL